MNPIPAQASITPATASAGVVYLLSGRKATSAHAIRKTPPIVGVPCLMMCPAGPSSRICCPNARRRKNAMNSGPIADRQHDRDHACGQRQLHGATASTTASRPIDRLPLTSTTSPGASSSPIAPTAWSRVANHEPP